MRASFIDCALTINKRVLTIPACAELLRAMDDVYGTRGPFDSVFNIQMIVNRSKTPLRSPGCWSVWSISSACSSWRWGISARGSLALSIALWPC